ncbi:MAG: cyclic nucleotide-binding domain-containing protein [Chitinivibrionales bacterium]|nr:cyclic nucleotide-binding domain-containing protein [Chitinivibrionales bacterium]MBD3356968.1 cyclic nucleotide-binding domain-containing protein [Chitinivibrionales bacterium]
MDNPLWTYIFGPPAEKRDMVELLRTLPAFEGLSSNELLQIERRLHLRRYRADELVFEEGMPGAGMYIVKEGEVVIQKRIGDDHTVNLAFVKERSFFGELALIDEMPRSASARTTRDTVMLALGKPDLEHLTEQSPRLAVKVVGNIARLVCKRLVRANENLETLQTELNELRGAARTDEETAHGDR